MPPRHARHALGHHGNGQRTQRGAQELPRGDRHRVPPRQQPPLPHRERRGHQHRGQHKTVAAGRRPAAAPSGGHQADPPERHREPDPGHRPRHRPVPHRRDHRDQHRHRPDQQRRMADTGPPDPRVLQDHRPPVPHRPRQQHLHPKPSPHRTPTPRIRRGARCARNICSLRGTRGARLARGAAPGACHGQQDRGGQAEPGGGEPARRQPLQGQLGQRHAPTRSRPSRPPATPTARPPRDVSP
jgi:hypothetical protein